MLRTPGVKLFSVYGNGNHILETMVHLRNQVEGWIEEQRKNHDGILVQKVGIHVLDGSFAVSVAYHSAGNQTSGVKLIWVEEQKTVQQTLTALQAKIQVWVREIQPENGLVVLDLAIQRLGRSTLAALAYWLEPFTDFTDCQVLMGYRHGTMDMQGALVDLDLEIERYLHGGKGPRGIQRYAEAFLADDREVGCLLMYRRRT